MPSWLLDDANSIAHSEHELAVRERGRRQLLRSSKSGKYAATTALIPEYGALNRYADIVPYERTRVVLPDESFVNASWITETLLEPPVVPVAPPVRRWISAQA